MAASSFLSFLHAACTCSSREQSVLEQRCRFLPLHPRPHWGRDGEGGFRLQGQTTAAPKPSPGGGRRRIGPISSAWLLQLEWGDFSPPSLPLPPPEPGGSRLAQRKHQWGNQKKLNHRINNPIVPRNPQEEGCSASPHRHPKNPCPWHLPEDQRSLHLAPHSRHRPPSTVPTPPSLLPAAAPSTKLCPFPSFALFQPLSPSPGAGKASPPARQSSRQRHQGGTSGRAWESGALLPLTRRSLPSTPKAAAGPTAGHRSGEGHCVQAKLLLVGQGKGGVSAWA